MNSVKRFCFGTTAGRWAAPVVVLAVVVGVALAGFVSLAGASVPVGGETQGNGNTWVLTDSVRPGGPTPIQPAYMPTNDLGIVTDDGTAAIPGGLPFDFTMQGQYFAAVTPVHVSANGLISFDAAFDDYDNEDLAVTAVTPALITPFWDDLDPNGCVGSAILSETFGTTPNRVLVIGWSNVCHRDGGNLDGFTFQARLFETSNAIEFHYSDVEGEITADNGISATVGIKAEGDNSGGLGIPYLQYAFDTTSPVPIDSGGFAIRFNLCDTTTPTVTTANGLDAAIHCYNQQQPAGNHTITLDADFSHPGSTPAVTQSNSSFSLTISGAGHTVTGPGSSGDDLFTLSSPSGVTITNITLAGAAENAIEATTGVVLIDASTVTTSQSTGVVVTGTARVTVANSTISGNNAAGIVAVGGSLAVSNSTISGNTNSGIAAFGGTVQVANSTITNNSAGLATSAPAPTVSSSIITNNTGDDCSGSIVDGGNNYASDASCSGFTTLSPAGAGSLGALDNNGGPTKTQKLLIGSNAVDAGDCTDVVVSVDSAGNFVTGDLAFDQRGSGFPRTIGAGCDAGAFEADPCAGATATPTVSNATELDAAIGCYNQQQPAGNHTITLGADFPHPNSTPPITPVDNAISLTITSDATHRTITGPGANSVSGEIDLFEVSGTAPVTFDNITLAGGDDDAIQANIGTTVTVTNATARDSAYGIFNTGTMTVSNSTITNNSTDGITNAGTMTVSNSTITNNNFDGIDNTGAMTVSNSTITNNSTDGIDNTGTMTVSNSTIKNNFDGITNTGTVTASNSTITTNNRGIYRLNGQVSVVSSIVANNATADCDGSVIDGGNNFASDDTCAGFTTLSPAGAGSLSALDDNGGPTQTQKLLNGSNAVDAGDCTDVVVGVDSSGNLITGDLEFDQRGPGFPRAIGLCDAGAFEADTLVRYNPLTPSRILDTRPGFASAGNPADGPDTPVGAGDANVRTVKVADLPIASVPANATAVAVHVTSVGPTANSFLTVWPDGGRPNAASKNYGITAGGPFGYAGLTNDLLIVPVGPNGTIQVYNDAGTVDLVIDIVGYYAPTGDLYNPLTPSRILDTRPGFASAGNPADGPDTPIGAGDSNVRTVKVADLAVAGVPANATAVAIHVTSVGPTANSFLTVWPTGTRPNAASKNYGITAGGAFGYAGLTNDLLIVPVGPGGNIQVYNDAGTVDLVIDIVGYYTPTAGDLYNPLQPSRILDTRPGFDSAGNPADGPDTPIAVGATRTITVADLAIAGVPANATAVAIHVTSVGPTANSFLTVWPDGGRPNAASKNYGITAGGPFGYAGLTNDLLIVPVGPGGTIQIYNDKGSVDLVIDIVGYYTN